MLRCMTGLFTALLVVPIVAHGKSDSAHTWAGVWHGTLGKYPITACLQQDGMDAYFGAYYYEKRLRVITLRPDQEAGNASLLRLVESDAMPKRSAKGAKAASTSNASAAQPDVFAHWELQPPAGDSLQGRFLGAKDAALAIALHRVGAVGDSCGGTSFTDPLHVAFKVTVAKPDGKADYVEARVEFSGQADYQIAGFQLAASDAASMKINGELMKNLRQEGQNALDCRSQTLDSSGYVGDYESTTEPALLSSRWLVTRNTGNVDCGGVHPNALLDYATWDRATGKETDPWAWLTPAAVKRTTTGTGKSAIINNEVQPALDKLLTRHWTPRDDCGDVAMASSWQPHPGLHGLIFTPNLPHVAFACTEDVEISYRDMLPLLNAAGREAAKTIEAEPKALEKAW
ncbi:MAG: hypothetical protein JO002_12975 [Burkholderiaceae bacterium]|nr:hypothetical protein [Burkholderiaceae bacterium]